MPIVNDVSGVPGANAKPERKPSSHPLIVNKLAGLWYDQYLESGKADYARALEELPYRLSDSGIRCDRQLYYKLQDVMPSNPPGPADAWRFELGHYVGNEVAALFEQLGDGWFSEWIVDLRSIGVQGSGHADIVHLHCPDCGPESPMVRSMLDEKHARFGGFAADGVTAVDDIGNVLLACADCGHAQSGQYQCDLYVEVKSSNGFGFKKATIGLKGGADGPRSGHILQGTMGAKALGCERVVIAYFAMENLSPDNAKRFAVDGTEFDYARFSAEWHYAVSGSEPVIEVEVQRIKRLLNIQASKLLPAREIVNDPEYPDGAVIQAPKARGRWHVELAGNVTQTGTTWFCDYCQFVDKCVEDGAGGDSDEVDL